MGKSWEAVDKNGWPPGSEAIFQKGVYCFAASGPYLFAGTNGLGVFLSTDGGASWKAANTGLPAFTIYSIRVSGPNIFAVGVDDVFRSTNLGASWTRVNGELPNIKICDLAICGPHIIVGTEDHGVFVSKDNGMTWSAANAGLPPNTSVYHLAVSGTSVLTSASRSVYRSADNGRSWAAVSGIPKDTDVGCFEVNGPNVYIGTEGRGVFQSKDNGKNWMAINLGWTPENYGVMDLVATDTQLFVRVKAIYGYSLEYWRMPRGVGPAPGQPTTQEYLDNADRAYRERDFANAVVFYSKVVEQDPKSVHAWLQRAWSYVNLGGKPSFDSALADTATVLELEPGNKDVYWVRGEIYINLANSSLDKKNAKEAEDYANKAIADLQIALEANPKSREIALNIGDARLAKRDLEGALADYAKVLEKDPNDWNNVIISHLDRLFETCDKQGRDCDCDGYKDAWYLAGKFQDRKKHFDRAIKCYSKAIELGLTDSSVYWSRAADYDFIGELDKALSDANTIIKLDPRSYAYKFRADIYQRKGKLDKAIDDYHKANKALRGEIKKTEYSEQTAQAVDKEAYEIHLGTADAYMKKQNWSKAIDEYQAAIEFTVNPGLRRAFVLYRIGLVYQKKGDAANAQKYIQQAEAMDPEVKKR